MFNLSTKAVSAGELMKKEKKTVLAIYAKNIGPIGDKVRMRLFLLSPCVYDYVNKLYSVVIVPLRQK